MKRILLASAALIGTAVSAQAADMAVKAPVYKAPVMAVYNWTGFYMGVNAGVGVNRDRVTHSYTGDSLYVSPQGGFGGAQIGWNWQTDSILGPLVYGLEADIQGSGMTGGGADVLFMNPTSYSQKSDWFGTVRGRLGLATGPVLSYVTAGFAYGNVKSTIAESGGGTFTDSRTATGWTIGSGVEAALGGNWTGKIEYLYLDLGNRHDEFGPPAQIANTELRENLFRVGLNYRIGGNSVYTPVAAANWSGLYIGGNFGSGTGRNPTTLGVPGGIVGSSAEHFSLNPDGYNAGGQIGYNWQAANWVYGLEADIQGSTQRDNKTVVAGGLVAYDQKLPWFGTVRGRLGYSVGSSLFYATGGYAYGGVKTKLALATGGEASFNTTRSGWTAGAGLETPFQFLGLFGPNWTSKTEYLYVDLGRADNLIGGGTFVSNTHVTEHILRTGLNYHFNTPVVAKY